MQSGRRSCFWVLLAIVTVLVSCDMAFRRPGARTETAGAQAMSPGLRAAYIAAMQARASDEYRVEHAATTLSAANPAQGMTAAFTGAGVELAPAAAEGARWSVAPARWGCEGDLRAVSSAEP